MKLETENVCIARLSPKKQFKEATRPQAEEVRSPTCEVSGAAATKNLGIPGYQAPVRQQPCIVIMGGVRKSCHQSP